MKTTKLNDWINLGASLGVIIGLVLVAWEIRQNNQVAQVEALVSIMATWNHVTMMEADPQLAELIAKSFDDESELSDAELVQLAAWLQTIIQANQEDLEISRRMGMTSNAFLEFESDVFYYFGTDFSRAWYNANKYWIDPRLASIIDAHIAEVEVGAMAKYFESIRDHVQEAREARRRQATRSD